MKNFKFSIILLFLAGIMAVSCGDRQQSVSYNELKTNFQTPPADVRVGVYWYWMNDNISVEGIQKDLEAMKAAGITKAFIGNIGGETQFPQGKVKIFTDQWWEAVHAALKKASELDIEIGMFNCPGWSQSGGPWIKPSQAMRYMAFADTTVAGNQHFSGKLIPAEKDFQDVKVLAFPVNNEPDAVTQTGFVPAYSKAEIAISLPKPEKIRTLVILPNSYFFGECELQAKTETGYQTIRKFEVDRSNEMLNVGWDKLAKVQITFPAVETQDFRLIFDNRRHTDAHFSLTLTAAQSIERYPEKSLAKMFQTPLPYWDSYMWEEESADTALSVNPANVIDISDKLAVDGTITWDIPEGNWVIMRTGMAPTGIMNSPAPPEGKGLEVDKMNKEYVAYHFDRFIGEALRRIPEADRKSLKYVIQDSYEMGGQNMTDSILEEFQKRYGYDPAPYLPALQGFPIGSPDQSDRFLWDLRRLIADKISYDFVGGFAEVSHKHGLKVWLENYGHWGFPGEFLQYGGQSDGIGGEFWAAQGNDRYEPRIAASCGHIYNKNVISAESFTSGGVGYKIAPKDLKFLLDWSMAEGINETLLHVYIQQAYDNEFPGIDAWFGTEFNRCNTWFSQLDLFTAYIRRSNYMLRQGLHVADAAYFIGEDVPKMVGTRQPEIPRGYDFDYINAEVIERDLQVKNGLLTLPHGTSYRVLVLPPQTTMRPALLKKIEKLVAQGAVIVGTQTPDRSPSLENYPNADEEVKKIANKMWGNTGTENLSPGKKIQYGKGWIFHNTSLEEVFAELNLKPDFLTEGVPDREVSNTIFDKTTVSKLPSVLYNHRTDGDREIYFVANQTENPIEINAAFRVQGKQPELWNATDGSVRLLPGFSEKDGITTVPLKLENLEGYFVVFNTKSKKTDLSNLAANFPAPVKNADISTGWTVAFTEDSIRRGLENVTFAELKSWPENENPQIKYYSGTAVYSKKFDYQITPKSPEGDSQVFVEFENVADMAKVKINGQYAGGCWTAPYRVNISGLLKEGENTIEVEVVNKWGNRLIGDSFLPFEQRKVRSYCTYWYPDMPLQPSGLIGQVQIVEYQNL
ncbi:MAG: glycoside hydrolase family 2 [Dysgonamonadaceae bacterium]|jgi:hypothetical protein|nr:glycoside hydrolase family 2 [Dysgonamonadaceae bacterium]